MDTFYLKKTATSISVEGATQPRARMTQHLEIPTRLYVVTMWRDLTCLARTRHPKFPYVGNSGFLSHYTHGGVFINSQCNIIWRTLFVFA